MSIRLVVTFCFALLVGTISAMACACCSDEGDWSEGFEPLTGHTLNIIQSVKLAPVAHSYSGRDDKGITIASGPVQLKHSRKSRTWALQFTDKSGKKGRLWFKIPKRVHVLSVDPKPKPNIGGLGPSLYYKLRLKLQMRGDGIFKLPKPYYVSGHLILHGSGLRCMELETFHHWTLDVNSDKVQFRFFGELTDSP